MVLFVFLKDVFLLFSLESFMIVILMRVIWGEENDTINGR